ncbi:STAS domain-containing protein [Streptomyces bambusae]|uniref:STAS domain-containing protein n=1 Tax=Streptomyces bambusae TaxID=1550616 RepID=UPI001CFDD651|nr:STAS domain-containing protein [Streptomyces bambusae]MCB5163984.1 STAS domain-containing protein [Streptomyces bambusae]
MSTRAGRVAVVFEPGPQRVRARVSGEIDMDDAADLYEDLHAALDAGRRGLDIDLADVRFCDSSGLHALLDLNRTALEAGKTIALTAVSRPVARLLRITGADSVLTLHGRTPPAAPEFRTGIRRYGPTAHLTPAGELGTDPGSVLAEVSAALDGVDVVACDMRDLTSLDLMGLHRLLDFVRGLDARGITVFAYNWQPQPRRLLSLVEELYPPADPRTTLLRSLRESAAAAGGAGAAQTGEDTARSAFPDPA